MFLNEIIELKREEVLSKREYFQIIKRGAVSVEKRGKNRFYKAINKKGVSVIAEFKKKSPSAGVIAEDKSPQQQALQYQEGGASAISVLTDETFFGGSVKDLSEIKTSVNIPVLRKDFIIDEGQIYESFFIGADAVLLITRAVEFSKLRDFIQIVRGLGMDALVEIHNHKDLDTALRAGAGIIGVNNRDLDTFKVDTNVAMSIIDDIPLEILSVSESGVFRRREVADLERRGYNAVLIGTSLMVASNPTEFLLYLRGEINDV